MRRVFLAVIFATFGCRTVGPIIDDIVKHPCKIKQCAPGETCIEVGTPPVAQCSGTPAPTPTPTPTPTPEPTPSPTPEPTPTPEGCILNVNPSEPIPDEQYTPKYRQVVLDALIRLRPDCSVGGTCLLGDTTQQEWQRAVEAEIRKAGVCAGQHVYNLTDEIAVSGKLGDPLEGWDVFTGDDTEGPVPPGGARRTVVWAKWKGVWRFPGTNTSTDLCPAPRWENYAIPTDSMSCTYTWGLKVGRRWVDATLTVQRCCKFCEAIGMGTYNGAIRCQCPLRPEGNPERIPCEKEAGAVWQVRGGTLYVNPENIAEANCEGVGCQVRVCTKTNVCSVWVP